jgi:hypothetical protein
LAILQRLKALKDKRRALGRESWRAVRVY